MQPLYQNIKCCLQRKEQFNKMKAKVIKKQPIQSLNKTGPSQKIVKSKVNTNLENKKVEKKKERKGGKKKDNTPCYIMEEERKLSIKSKEQLMVEASEKIYGINVKEWKKMGGLGGDFNIYLKMSKPQGKLFLKVSPPHRKLQRLTEETEILNFLKKNHTSIHYPGTKKSLKGNLIPWFEVEGKTYRFRLMEFVQGIEMSHYGKFSNELLQKIGQVIGEMSKCLAKYPKKISSSHMIPFDLKAMKHYAQIKKPSNLLDKLIENYKQKFLPTIGKRPEAVIHGDLHLGNLKVNKLGEVVGIFDFGCSGMSHPGYDIGTLMADFSLRRYSFNQLSYLLKGFHKTYPFTPEELPLFYYFFCPRLMFMMRFFRPSGDRVRQIMVNKGQKSIEKQLFDGLICQQNTQKKVQDKTIPNTEEPFRKEQQLQHYNQNVSQEKTNQTKCLTKNLFVDNESEMMQKKIEEMENGSSDDGCKIDHESYRINEIKLKYKLSQYTEDLNVNQILKDYDEYDDDDDEEIFLDDENEYQYEEFHI